MKKLFVIIALAMPLLVNAQKLGHINTQELFQTMPELATVRAKMDTIQGQYENQLVEMQEEIQKKIQDYQQNQASMPEAVKNIREQELQEMQQRLQTFYQTAEQDIQKRQQELLVPLHEKMSKAIKAVGEREGYTYVFDSAAMTYISPDANDLMPLVKKELGIK